MRERSRGLLGLIVLGASLGLAGVPAAPARAVDAQATATATFAGGCFWCMQPPFEKLAGVVSTTVGYTGGHTKNPTYEEVSAGGTGHAESVQIVYDPPKISYEQLLDVFWHNVDPLTPNAQFCDHGRPVPHARSSTTTTRSAASPRSRSSASRRRSASTRPIVTEIVAADRVLPGRGVPPEVPREESRAVQVLSLELRPRPAPEGAVGRAAEAEEAR